MQAVKNLLHSNNDDTSRRNENTHNPSIAGNPGYNTASSGVGSSESRLGSTTGDSQRTGLTSGNNAGLTSQGEYADTTGTRDHHHHSSTGSGLTGATSTNTSATRDTGLAQGRTADTTTGGAGRTSRHLDHTLGHDHSAGSRFDPTSADTTHDHKHLDHVTHRDVRHVEVEEVERQRELDRHIHHVQHHVQPVVDKQVNDEVHHHNTVPVTKISERHTSTDEDKGLFDGLASQHRDSETHRGKERTVVDLGERVHENVHHHVHHVTQPVIEQEVVDRHKIHTVIPTHHVTHEAPIIHKSSTHEPVSMDSFVKGGGKIGSGIKHHEAGVLNIGECERTVEGDGENLIRKLNLGGSNYSSTGTTSGYTGSNTTGSNTGYGSSDRYNESNAGAAMTGSREQHADGTRDSGKYVANDGERHNTKVGQMADNAGVTK